MIVQVQSFNNLMKLSPNVIILDKNRLQPATGYQPSFHYLCILSQNHPILRQSDFNHSTIILSRKKQGIVSHYPQPLRQFANIIIDDELNSHSLSRSQPLDDPEGIKVYPIIIDINTFFSL